MRGAIVAALVLLIAGRTWLAARLDLLPDEAFYWLCSRRLDLGYSDHPPMTALLVRLGTWLGGHTPLGVRWPFGACGALTAVLVWMLARRLSGVRDGWWALGLCLSMPLLQLTSTLATPDAPLLLFAAATLLSADRAARGGRTRDWALAGACAGLGMATHYRFALVPASILAWLALTRAGRRRWSGPGPWCAAGLTLAGGLPVLAFNLREGFAPLRYQALERHGAPIGARAWFNQLVEQGLVVTPVLYVALLLALLVAWRRARRGDERAAAQAFCAGVPLAIYFLASPLTDQQHDHVHWPQVGYLPLLAFAPEVLRGWAERHGRAGRLAVIVAPALAGAMLVAAAVDLATGRLGFMPRSRFLGLRELAPVVAAHRASAAGAAPVLVADTYATASQLAFKCRGAVEVYALDHPMNARHGRALQYALWGLDEHALRTRAGEDALLVMDRSATSSQDTAAWEARVRTLFDDVRRMDAVIVPGRGFTVLRATGVRAVPSSGTPP